MKQSDQENRKYKRHGTQGQLLYNFTYEVKTEMEFEIEDENFSSERDRKFSALSKNLSVEGMCFMSDKKLKKGTPLHVSLHIPESSETVDMEGEVKWSESCRSKEKISQQEDKPLFDTGIKLWEVNGRSVSESIHYDELFNLQWSVVLESVFGRYRLIMDKRKKEKQE